MRIAKLAFLPLLLLQTDRALAQDEAPEEDRKIVYKQKTEIDFEGLDIEGVLQKPQGALVIDRRNASFNPLIKLRTDFNAEISQSTNDVK
jgi:hypothetical protein